MHMVVTVWQFARFPSVVLDRVIVKHSVSSTTVSPSMVTSNDLDPSVLPNTTLAGTSESASPSEVMSVLVRAVQIY